MFNVWPTTDIFNSLIVSPVGRNNVVGIETRYWSDGPAIEPRIEFSRIRLGRPWGPTSLLYKGYRVIPGVKRWGVALTTHPI